jgi:hypothetical protein
MLNSLGFWLGSKTLGSSANSIGVDILFKNKGKSFIYKMNLIYKAETKLLGVYIMETLKWNIHVKSLANKLSKVSFMIKSLKKIESIYDTKYLFFKIPITFTVWNTLWWRRGGDNLNKTIYRIQKG